jgi:protein TonB
METSENGSTIISDGTGQMPVLDPKKVSEAADIGAQSVDVLVLTHDEEFLATVRDSARGLHNVIYANTLQQANDAVRKHKVGVAVIDAAMVGSNVEKLTLHFRATAPRLVAIVAGRRDDGEMLMGLINRGKVYRFLLKPVSPGRARLAIEASVRHHLEAPDTAFAKAGQAAPAPQAKPAPKPAVKAEPKPAPEPKATPKPAAVEKAAKPEAKPATPKAKTEPEVAMVANRDEALSPVDDGLDDAFGGDNKGLTETMTGIVKSVRKPFSRTADDAAGVADATADAGSGGSIISSPKVLGLGAAAVVAVVAIGFWLFSSPDDAVQVGEPASGTPSVTEAEPAFDAESPSQLDSGVDDLLVEARLAADAGQIFNPPGSNAIELYMAAINLAPGDATVEAEFNAIVEQALAMAESAMLDSRADDVAAALERVQLADPDNSRLPFMNAQLAQMQLRNYLDESRVAIREARFEDAQLSIDRARALTVADPVEIDAVAEELTAALSAQRVDDVLAKANARLEEGKLIAPSNDNARYYYDLALSNDPENTAARQGLIAIASKLALQARTQIDQGNFDAAGDLIREARRLDPSSAEVSASADALRAARDRIEQERVAAERRAAEQRAAAERAAAERAAAERAAAERAAAERVAAERAAAERAAAEQPAAAASRAQEEVPVAMAVQAEPEAAEPQILAANRATDTGLAADESSGPGESATIPPPLPKPVSVSSLKRTRYVAPKYPRSAQRRGLSGWVDVVFTVDIDGTVSDITVRDSNPGEVFVASAINAVEDWEFEPVIENGVAIQKRAAVRMMFAIE